MDSHAEFNKRLQDAKDRIKRELESLRKREINKTPEKKTRPIAYLFRPYETMFKLTDLDRKTVRSSKGPRKVKCVNCGEEVLLSVFLDYQKRFETKCYSCDMTAEVYWDSKPHRKVP